MIQELHMIQSSNKIRKKQKQHLRCLITTTRLALRNRNISYSVLIVIITGITTLKALSREYFLKEEPDESKGTTAVPL